MERAEIFTHGRAQALWHEGGLRRDHRHGGEAPARAAARGRRPAHCRDHREAGALDQVSDHHRQAAAGQGHRRLRLRGHADQRDAGARPRRRRLPRPSAQRRAGRRDRHRENSSCHRDCPELASVAVPVAASSTSSISSTGSRPRRATAGRAALPIICPARTSSFSTNSAICPSPSPAVSCCST